MFRQLAHRKGLEFYINLDSAIPDVICTDPKRLQQLLKNLLSNAFKVTKTGSVTLGIAPRGKTARQMSSSPEKPPDR